MFYHHDSNSFFYLSESLRRMVEFHLSTISVKERQLYEKYRFFFLTVFRIGTYSSLWWLKVVKSGC